MRMTEVLDRAWRATTTSEALLRALGPPDLATALPADTSREQLAADARHQADLLAHPYVGPEHLHLAALRILDRHEAWRTHRATLAPGLPDQGWRPRGCGPPHAEPDGGRRISVKQRRRRSKSIVLGSAIGHMRPLMAVSRGGDGTTTTNPLNERRSVGPARTGVRP